MNREARRRCCAASTSTSTSRQPLVQLQHRDPADGRHRPRGRRSRPSSSSWTSRPPRSTSARSASCSSVIRQLQGGRRRGDLRQPQARRALRGLRPRHDHARRPHGRTSRRWPTIGKLELVAAMLGRDLAHGRRRGPPASASAAPRRRRAARGRAPARRPHACATSASRSAPARSSASPACSAPAAPRLARAIFGADRARRGDDQPRGQAGRASTSRPTPSRAGIGFCSEDRKVEGIIPEMSVRENLTLALLPRLTPRRHRRRGAGSARSSTASSAASASSAPAPSSAIRELSGGNQQKVLLARWLCHGPEAPDPRRADPRHRRRRQGRDPALIRELAEQGLGVLMISSELEEVIEGSRPRRRAARRAQRRRAGRRGDHRARRHARHGAR